MTDGKERFGNRRRPSPIYVCELPENAAPALRWLAERIEHYTLVYKHDSLNACAWGGLANAPGGIWSADKVAFDTLDDACRFEEFLTEGKLPPKNA